MFAVPVSSMDEREDRIRIADLIEAAILLGDRTILSIDEVVDELDDTPPDDVDALSESLYDRAYYAAEEAYTELAWRCAFLSDRYPLTVSDGVVERRDDSPCREVYRFLAMLRIRQICNGGIGDANRPGYLFECLATIAIAQYIGTARRFGTSGGSRGDELPLPFDEAVRAIAEQMSESAASSLPTDNGDYRADVIGWKEFGDSHSGQVVILCQATITYNDWAFKHLANRWKDNRFIEFSVSPVCAAAFVETLSLYDTMTCVESNRIPFDRLRIAKLIADADLQPDLLAQINEWTEWARGQVEC